MKGQIADLNAIPTGKILCLLHMTTKGLVPIEPSFGATVLDDKL
jgi:hypothetical protein